MACTFVGQSPTSLGLPGTPTYYVAPTNAALFAANGAFKLANGGICSFDQAWTTKPPFKAVTTSTVSVEPALTWWEGSKQKTAKCDVLKPKVADKDGYIAYSDISCDLKWSTMSGLYTLGFEVDNWNYIGPKSVVTDKFYVYPVTTSTSTTEETTTWYTTLSPEPLATTTMYEPSATTTTVLSVPPTPAATTTISPYKTTETAILTESPDPYSTTT